MKLKLTCAAVTATCLLTACTSQPEIIRNDSTNTRLIPLDTKVLSLTFPKNDQDALAECAWLAMSYKQEEMGKRLAKANMTEEPPAQPGTIPTMQQSLNSIEEGVIARAETESVALKARSEALECNARLARTGADAQVEKCASYCASTNNGEQCFSECSGIPLPAK